MDKLMISSTKPGAPQNPITVQYTAPPPYPTPQGGYQMQGPGYPHEQQHGFNPHQQQPGFSQAGFIPPKSIQPGFNQMNTGNSSYQQQPMNPVMQVPGQVIITKTTIPAQPETVVHSVIQQPLSHMPQTTRCPQCNTQVMTRVDYTNGSVTWAACLITSLIGCCLFCWIPFCVSSCKNANHYCPSCGAFIGSKVPF